MFDSVQEILNKEVNIREFLAMEIELSKLKELLATEIKLKEFLVQEIDLTNLMSRNKLEAHHAANNFEGDSQLEVKVLEQSLDCKKKMIPPYDYTLIETLHIDHKEMLFIYNELMKYAGERDYSRVAKRLELFSKKIREHFHKADVELYEYLKCYIQQKYPKREKAFTELSLEMKNISIEIFFTVSQSPNIPLNDKNYDAFMKEFRCLGREMNNRIHREESVLFMMYKKSHEAIDICSQSESVALI
jgi:hypothetical protein